MKLSERVKDHQGVKDMKVKEVSGSFGKTEKRPKESGAGRKRKWNEDLDLFPEFAPDAPGSGHVQTSHGSGRYVTAGLLLTAVMLWLLRTFIAML